MKTVIPIVVVILIAFVTAFNCGPKSPTGSGEPGFAIHEWGVLVGCSTDTTGFVTSRPEYASMAREPVIYVHKRDKEPFSVRAIFSNGQPTVTYPAARIAGDTVIWEQIGFSPWVRTVAGVDTSNFVPLEEIIDQLNNVDADLLYVGGTSARFLFYEGWAPNINMIAATPLPEDTSVILSNIGGYTVYDVAYSTSHPTQLGPLILMTAHIDSLASGQTDTVKIVGGVPVSFADQLEGLGFTESEASAFANLWQPSFYESAVAAEAVGNVIFRIPQSIYDNFITLEIDPQPEEVIRALYVLNHIYE